MKNLLDFYFVTGLVTSVRTRVLGSSPEQWLTTTTYYDDRCRVNASRTDMLEVENSRDDRGRLLSSTTRLNGGSPATVEYTYDAVGRLVSKKLGGTTETLAYNARGWLTSKESVSFEMKLRYEKPEGGGVACWNGNISEWEWQQGSNVALMYGFAYDGVNRLRETTQKQKSGTAWST
ncbi:MAG: RHS repeat protein, partial [Bacteroidales bacterium]|nr:RHS repeat protein [Bacteroidales bacterium]